MPYQYEFPRPAVTVDCVVFAWHDGQLSLLLIERAHEPFKGHWALPGGFVDPDEGLVPAAKRELLEETNLTVPDIKLFGAFGDPGRDPRGHTITLAYYTIVREEKKLVKAGSDAKNIAWVHLDQIKNLAFDHQRILAEARQQLMDDIRMSICDNTIFYDLTKQEKETLLTTLSD